MEATLQKKDGVHYTPPRLARFLAEQTVRFTDPNRESIRVLDPACGDGELLTALLTALPFASSVSVTGFDTNLEAVKNAGISIADFELRKRTLRQVDFLDHICEHTHLGPLSVEKRRFDCVIANPPYVRTQVLGGKRAQLLSKKFGLTGRVDLYQAFTFGISKVLRPGGVLGLLTSNRFLTVKAGQSMRQLLNDQFSVRAIYDLGDTKLFDAAVLPVVLIAVKKPCDDACVGNFSRIYVSAPVADARPCRDVLDELADNVSGHIHSDEGTFNIERGQLATDSNTGIWSLENKTTAKWLAQIRQHQIHAFSDLAEIKVGIKTTADNVFVKTDWSVLDNDISPERRLLRPLLTHHVAQRWSITSPARKHVLYPYEPNNFRRTVVSQAKHPKAFAYFEKHREQLESRQYVVKSGRKWFEIWVPHQPRDWAAPKIVWPDISQQPKFFLDSSGAIVNGDCYWIKLREGVDTNWLFMMLAVANSTIATQFYDTRFFNKLYAGRRRFMTQYVQEFPLPDLETAIGKKIVAVVKQLIESPTKRREARCEQLVQQAFGIR